MENLLCDITSADVNVLKGNGPAAKTETLVVFWDKNWTIRSEKTTLMKMNRSTSKSVSR